MTDARTKNAPLAVQLEHCTKRYGTALAAEDVCLEVRAGEFFTLLGASGSGKTTSLRMIGGFEMPDSGTVRIMGEDVTRFPAHKRNVHTVFQDYALFPHLTVYDNVAFALKLRGIPWTELDKRVMEAIRLVQLTGFENRKPSQLSGGQQQRVALARAIVDHPAVLLLDEPLSALDAKIRGEVREELKRLQRDTGITFIYVTHDQEEALTMSDRMAVMRGGKVLQIGTPLEVYEGPADLFVAQFIGKANFIQGQLKQVDGNHAVVAFDGKIAEGTLTKEIPVGSSVQMMIRPENMNLVPGNAPAPLTGSILQTHFLGHGTEYIVTCGTSTFRSLELRKRGDVPLAEGQQVALSWDWEEALVFEELRIS